MQDSFLRVHVYVWILCAQAWTNRHSSVISETAELLVFSSPCRQALLTRLSAEVLGVTAGHRERASLFPPHRWIYKEWVLASVGAESPFSSPAHS